MELRPSVLKGNLFVLFFTVLMIVLVGEAAMRVYLKYGRSIVTVSELTIYQASTLTGYEHLPGSVTRHGHGEPMPEVKINSFGMRDDAITLEKPENTVRIVFLGDSFTFGMGLRHDDIVSEVLERRLNREFSPKTGKKYEVLNMGVIGQSVDQEYLLLRDRALQFNPDIAVINFFAGNDATELRRHDWIWSKDGHLAAVRDATHFIDDDNALRRETGEAPKSYLLWFVEERAKLLLGKFGIASKSDGPLLVWPNFLPPDHPDGDPRLEQFWEQIRHIFGLTKELADERGIKLLVTGIPLDMQVSKKYWSKHPGVPFGDTEFLAALPQKLLEDATAYYSIDYLDLLPVFRAREEIDTYWLIDDPHWTPEGHAMAADAIFDYMLNQKWL